MNNINLEGNDFETRWPQDGDLLFIESPNAGDAPVVRNPAERYYRMTKGYTRAGDVLIDHAAADLSDRRNLIYAALFCYRQAIELWLKRLIEEVGNGRVYSPKNTHDLECLWDRFSHIVNERGQSESVGLATVRKLVAEMHQADQKSDGFRFPTDFRGEPFPFGDRSIDLINLRNVMRGIENFFECVHLDFGRQDE